MPIEEAEWASISNQIELEVGRLIGRRRDYFIMAVVTDRNESDMVIWTDEFGIQPIPMFCFDYEVIYYDQDTIAGGGPPFDENTKTITPKFAKVRPLLPKVGQTVLIAREMGVDRLPRCLGVLRSKNFVVFEDDDDEAVI